ncbi:hypothetical protein GCM10007874_36840 [Labrys miyagiensis]|uniref:Uncharacterized protein n=1 Tax=Labrys miyagiensis TaxID=346912 RepID=A0ABQ6CQZ2_9HYPH|nr:hypothetical protein GCM10007874_36840 [Labrys miyagiensis]
MIRSWFRHLLPILAIVGMVLAPLAAPAGAGVLVAGMAVASPGMAMSGDMPCCADTHQKHMPDCGRTMCPDVAICMAKCFASGAVTVAPLPAPSHRTRLIGLSAQAQLTGLAPPPLIRPPRT